MEMVHTSYGSPSIDAYESRMPVSTDNEIDARLKVHALHFTPKPNFCSRNLTYFPHQEAV